MTQQIEIFTSQDGQAQLRVALENGTVWLSQSQTSFLFHTFTDNISLHLKNIFQSEEIDEKATTEKFSVVREEGKRKVQ